MHSFRSLAVAAAALLWPVAAFAHAQLEKANPGVGTTITAAPTTIALSFSEPVEPAFCSVTLSDPAGKPVPLGKPAPGAKATLTVPIKGKLVPGVYKVTWRAVSVDTHRTQGSFAFTLAP